MMGAFPPCQVGVLLSTIDELATKMSGRLPLFLSRSEVDMVTEVFRESGVYGEIEVLSYKEFAGVFLAAQIVS